MPRETLREDLRRLHTELRSVEDLDEDLHTLLRQVAGDIEEALGKDVNETRTHRPQLEALATRFEAGHPRLARILSELTDTISKLGI